MSDESFESLWRQAISEHVRAMPAGELNDLVAQVRPEAMDVRASIAAKANRLESVVRDENGALGSIQAAADAINQRLGNPQQPQQPEPAAPQQPPGFAPNRAQGAAGDWTPPINERQVNADKIARIRAERGL
jgi:hypothetical protein